MAHSFFTLENGITVDVLSTSSQWVGIGVFVVHGGSAYEEKWAGSGIASQVRQLIAQNLQSSLQSGEFSSLTNREFSFFFTLSPPEELEKRLQIIAHSIFHPSFPASDSLSEILLSRPNPSTESFLMDRFYEKAYREHPLRFPIEGYSDLRKQLKIEDLKAYHQQHYLPQNLLILLAGKLQEDKAEELLQKTWGSFPRVLMSPPAFPEEPLTLGPQDFFFSEKALTSGYLLIGFAYRQQDPEGEKMSQILGSLLEERLQAELIHRLALADSVEVESPPLPYPYSAMMIVARFPPQNLKAVQSQIYAEIQQIQEENLPQESFNTLMKKFSLDSVKKQVTLQGLVYARGLEILHYGRPDESTHLSSFLADLSSSDLREKASTIWSPRSRTAIILLPEGALTPEMKPPSPPHPFFLKHTFKSGTRIALEVRDDQPLVEIRLAVPFYQPPSRKILLMAKLSAEMLTNQIASSSPFITDIQSFQDDLSWGIRFQTLREDFNQALVALWTGISNTSFLPEIFEKVKQKVTSSENPYQEVLDRTREYLFLPPAHTGASLPSETLSAITRGEILTFFRDNLVPEKILLACVGGLDSEIALSQIEKILEPAGKVTPQPFVEYPAIKENLPAELHWSNSGGELILAFPAPAFTSPDRYPAEVLLKILSNRLATLLAKTPGFQKQMAVVDLSYHPGYILFTMRAEGGSSLTSLTQVEKFLWQEIEKIKSAQLSDPEVRSATQTLGNDREILRQSLNEEAKFLLEDILTGVENIFIYSQKLSAVTPADVATVARNYLTSRHLRIWAGVSL